jgi:hypothetical protein
MTQRISSLLLCLLALLGGAACSSSSSDNTSAPSCQKEQTMACQGDFAKSCISGSGSSCSTYYVLPSGQNVTCASCNQADLVTCAQQVAQVCSGASDAGTD